MGQDKPTSDEIALVDARILRLALALPAVAERDERWPLPHAETLVAYLTETLPREDRRQFERRLLGNPRAFQFLIAIRDALSGKGGEDTGWPSSAPAATPRIDLGIVLYREQGALLVFRREGADAGIEDTPTVARQADISHRLMSEEDSPREDSAPFDFLSRGKPEPVQLQLGQLREVTSLLADTLDSIERMASQIERGDDPSELYSRQRRWGKEAPEERIEELIGRLQEALGRARKFGVFRPGFRSSPQLRMRVEPSAQSSRAAASRPTPPMRRPLPPRWFETLTLAEGDASVEISGTAVPEPRLAVAISRRGAPVAGAVEVTIVQPGTDFSSAVADEHGVFHAPLPLSDVLVLVTADETFQFWLKRTMA